MPDGFIYLAVVLCIAISYCLKIVSWIVGWIIAVRDEHVAEYRQVLDKTIVITIEKENGRIFAYNHKNGTFLAQGNSYEEMLEAFQATFPNTIGLIFDPNSTSMREVSTLSSKEWIQLDKNLGLSSVK